MLPRTVKFHPIHTRNPLYHTTYFLRSPECYIGNHNPGRRKCHKILVHGRKPLPCLCITGQICGHIVFHHYPIHGKKAKKNGKHIQQKKQISLFHNKCCKPIHKFTFSLFLSIPFPSLQNRTTIDLFLLQYNNHQHLLQSANPFLADITQISYFIHFSGKSLRRKIWRRQNTGARSAPNS